MRNITLSQFTQELFNYTTLNEGLSYISSYAKAMTDAQRCSIFIYKQEEDLLWTQLADNTEKIIIPFDIGLVGQTIKTEKPILENDPYDNVNFLSDIDMQSGYYTQNILTAPLFNKKNKIIGVIELLNKEDGFTKEDSKSLSKLSKCISEFIELKE